MELSCDEAVMKSMDSDIKAEYSQSLLRFGTTKKMLHATPLAFGEGDTKSRVKNVLNYKKPAFWVVVVSVVAVVAVCVGLLVNPKDDPTVLPKGDEKYDYFIMTEEVGGIGCEYGVDKDNSLDTLQMISELEKLNGHRFSADWASHGYIKFVFNDKKPKDIFLRYCANIDDIWQQEYPIDSTNYRIKVPSKIGVYNFFADITWENGDSETAYFSIEVENNYQNGPALTKETADEFINQTLGTFQLNSNNTVSFTLPDQIPSDESGKTKLYISTSATFSPEPGTSSVQEILDWNVSAKTGTTQEWQGGENYIEALEMEKGKLTRMFLRVAFMTTAGENSYQEYAANFVEFTEPFTYDTPVEVTDRGVEIKQAGAKSVLTYTMQDGKNFAVSMTLPKGVVLSPSENYPEYAQSPDYDFPTVVVVKGTNPIGTLTLGQFGTDNKDDLKLLDTTKNEIPMQIFAGIAVSNHAMYDNYKVLKSSATGANATAKYLWQDLSDYAGKAPEAPWLKSDSILAYDYGTARFFVHLNLAEGSLSITELENLAKSVVIAR